MSKSGDVAGAVAVTGVIGVIGTIFGAVGLMFLVPAGLVGLAIYAAVHFIHKLW